MNTLLPLPIAPGVALKRVIVPALAELGAKFDSPEARAMLIAMALQESGLAARRQTGGPARGLWQFEQGGGVRGVLGHASSSSLARKLCALHDTPPSAALVYAALERDDVLAAGFARLLLWTLPQALPRIGDEGGAWEQYLSAWRPGKPHRNRWAANYRKAVEAVKA